MSIARLKKLRLIGLTDRREAVLSELQKLGCNPEYGLDKHYFDRAAKEGKTVASLETVDFQIGMVTDFSKEDAVEKKIRQSEGSHADEIETSMMLYIAPESVRMKKAARDLNPHRPGPLSRDPNGQGTYSPTGAWGDPTLATREKGEALVESQVKNILKEIDDLRGAPLPTLVAH